MNEVNNLAPAIFSDIVQFKMKWSDGPPSAVLVKYLSSAFPKPVLESPVIGGPGPISVSESDDPF